jgi:5-oxoprolinase (ATP-hydrolysing) subunit A
MMPMREIDLNVDLGEGGMHDAGLLAHASSANIASGGHAGDGTSIRRTIGLCMAAGVAVGAHPGFADRENFGRREMPVTPEQLHALVAGQLRGFLAIANDCGATLHHVKPHGALYHQADRDADLAAALVRALGESCPSAILYAPPCGKLAAAATAAGITAWAEGFADRRYLADGGLVPRGEPGAVITRPGEALRQALVLIESGKIRTLCTHGDGAEAVAIMRTLRRGLARAGVRITC